MSWIKNFFPDACTLIAKPGFPTTHFLYHTSCVMRKPEFCLCENKGADQLCSNCTADQHLCFGYTDSISLFLLNPKYQVFSHLLQLYRSVCVGPGLTPQRLFFLCHFSNTVFSSAHIKYVFVNTVNFNIKHFV